jgi:DNA-binding response OmpR family regulator
MTSRRILIVDDEPDILKVLKLRLEKHGYEIATASTGQAGLTSCQTSPPDLVILDLMLPDMDGYDVCKKLKSDAKTGRIPVMMLTARSESTDEVLGLELGADDYVTKPFEFSVLHSRIKNLLKRAFADETAKVTLRSGKLSIDPDSFKAFFDGREVGLTTTEFRILYFLMRNPGRLFSRNDVMKGAWKEPVEIGDRAVDVHINGIRSKIKAASDYIETVRGEGYRFTDQPGS